jgi:Methylamine utilisation protein MauE
MQSQFGRLRFVETTIAAVLLAAAGLKADQLFANGSPVIPGLIHYRTWLALLIEAECLLALWLLFGGFPRARRLCAMGCFGLFAVAAGYEALRAMPSCGCFGNVKVPPIITAVFDVSAVVALWLAKPVANEPPSRPRFIVGTTAGLLITVGVGMVYFLKAAPAAAAEQSAGGLVVLEPSSWVNKRFPLLDEIKGDSALKTGRWLLVLYHYDCDDCLRAIPLYCALAGRPRHVAFVAMPPVAPPGQDPVPASGDYLRLSLRPDHDWFATTPVAVALQDGRVIAAAEGEQAMQPPAFPR